MGEGEGSGKVAVTATTETGTGRRAVPVASLKDRPPWLWPRAAYVHIPFCATSVVIAISLHWPVSIICQTGTCRPSSKRWP